MKQTFRWRFQIAEVTLLLDGDLPISCDREFRTFESSREPDYVVQFREASELEVFDTEPVAEELGFRVFEREKTFIRQFQGADKIPYAVSESSWEEKEVTVQYLQSGRSHISHTGGAFFHIGWEELLLRKQRLILHACCVETAFGGILFSGVSGIGKSTQGQLWCDYEHAVMINGDRPVLFKKEGIWTAYGSPYAGSSRCHVNKHVSVRAIIMLAQGEKCRIRRLGGAEAFRRIFAQVTVGIWNPENGKMACDLSEQLASEVRVYELTCTPDRNAVNLLKETLFKEVNG